MVKQTVCMPIRRSSGKTQRRRRRGRRGGGLDGSMTVSRTEYIMDVPKTGEAPQSGKTYMDMSMDNIPTLKHFVASFEHVRWNSCQLMYKPSVSNNTAGMVAYAADYSFTSTGKDRKSVGAHMPGTSHAVWDSTSPSLTVPSSQLMSRRLYATKAVTATIKDSAPFRLLAASSAADTPGEIWIRYSVTLSGVRVTP